MPRAILIVLDSVGIGGAEDAAAYGDEGADTLGHIAEACAGGSRRPGRPSLRAAPRCPISTGSASARAAEASRGAPLPGLGACAGRRTRWWGYGVEVSKRQGHARPATGRSPACRCLSPGAISPRPFPTFPPELTDALIDEARLPGILGNKHASGTAIIAELGEEHVRTGKPICYTSANSVLQIAAHEDSLRPRAPLRGLPRSRGGWSTRSISAG